MFAVIYIPNFSLQAVLRHEPDLVTRPVALVDQDSAKARVSQASGAAALSGVSPGMTSTQAKARCPNLAFRLRSVPQEESAQEVLLESVYFSAAFIESTAPGLCTADLRGLPLLTAQKLEDALAFWGQQLRDRLAQFGLTAHIGIAAAPELARQAAQRDAPLCYVSDARTFWTQLPIAALAAPPQLNDILHKWGIRTVSDFLALGKARIAERLGSEGAALYEQARSDKVRPLRLTSPREIYEEAFGFEQCIETLEPLLFIIRRLLTQLTHRLQLAARSVAELQLKLQLESGETHTGAIKIASPSCDMNALFRITHNYLENVRTASPVIGVSLRAAPGEIETQQFQLFETSLRDPNRFYETVSRLGALLGPDRVGTPKSRDSYRPDDFELIRPSAPLEGNAKAEALLSPQFERPRGLPLRRFRPPLSATVRLKDGAPVFVQSAAVSGSIAQSRGPWRGSGNWWENLWAREEWDIQISDGALYRIFLENNHWFLEGAYD